MIEMLTEAERAVRLDRNNKYAIGRFYLYGGFVILAIYVAAGAYSPHLLATFDNVVTPMTGTLRYFGLDIHKPFLQWINTGVTPQFCSNVIGVALWIILIANIKAFIFYCRCRWSVPMTEGQRQLAQKFRPYQGGRWRNWFVSLVVFTMLAGFGILTVLNATHGWITFHVNNFFVLYLLATGYLLLFGLVIIQSLYGLVVTFSYLEEEKKVFIKKVVG